LFKLTHYRIFQGMDFKNGVYCVCQANHHDHSGALIMKYVLASDTSPSSYPAFLSTITEMTSIERSPTTGGVTMPISRTLNTYLDHEHVHYDVLCHPKAFRATDIAHALQTPEKEMAKVVIVKVGGRSVMTVLPASWSVDLHRLKDVFRTRHVRLATEHEIASLFPDCELGAMPPFGNLYGLPVYVDQSLTEDEEIVFQAGTHSDAIRMRYMDFAALVFPVVAEFHRSSSEDW
jgi:Ala-tRNA(Pro) deacylase